MTQLCSYGCGQPAIKQFDNKRWCCSKHVNGCPTKSKKNRERMLERYKNSNIALLRQLAIQGKRKCTYCCKTARHYLGPNVKGGERFCCKPIAYECPNYTKYVGDKIRERYRNDENLLNFQREHVAKMGKDPEIQEKKRESMLRLHRGDCEECKQFQQNFKEAHARRKKDD